MSFSNHLFSGCAAAAFLAMGLGAGSAHAQGRFSISACPDVAETQFKYVPLVGKTTSTQTKARRRISPALTPL